MEVNALDQAERRRLADAVRVLAMDAVQKAASGHPGMPMGMADIAEVLWRQFLKHNPADPMWPDRDRFVLSNGHGSMLLYALLHLSGYDLPMKELENFRQMGSRTPGHPEYGLTPGVETTTGPLGQGLGNAVGMAIAESILAERFNRPGHEIVDHRTWAFVGDGCLMEGISHEVCSLAGTLRLGKLNVIYDDNGISIDGEVEGWFTDDTVARFRAYGWHVIEGIDGHDSIGVEEAMQQAIASTDRPTLIMASTTIGWGSPAKAGTAAAHGAPLGEDEVAAVRKTIGWTEPAFKIPDDVRSAWDGRDEGQKLNAEWTQKFDAYRQAHPELAAEFERTDESRLPANFTETVEQAIAQLREQKQDVATRKASQIALETLLPVLPELTGGSADLTGSNNTRTGDSETYDHGNRDANYINYGVREFGMAAIMNGLALHGGLIPYAGTFLMFSEYARNAIRMAALMKQRAIFVFTHDSIGLGEDGPTHQAVEQAASLRLTPNLNVWRPCDTVESLIAWQSAVECVNGPSCLLFSRQGVPFIERDDEQVANIRHGGYILREATGGPPQALLIATGTEVSLALDVQRQLHDQGHAVRVVSMPSVELFDASPQAYRDSVLPPGVRARVAVEAGIGDLWRKYVGLDGAVCGVDSFGESAPWQEVYSHFGLTVDGVSQTVRKVIAAQT